MAKRLDTSPEARNETDILKVADMASDLERLTLALEIACDSERLDDDVRSGLSHLAHVAANMACLVKHELTLCMGAGATSTTSDAGKAAPASYGGVVAGKLNHVPMDEFQDNLEGELTQISGLLDALHSATTLCPLDRRAGNFEAADAVLAAAISALSGLRERHQVVLRDHLRATAATA